MDRLCTGLRGEGKDIRYAFVYGDFRRVHGTGLIACHYRAAEWRHKEIELAAHDLLTAPRQHQRLRIVGPRCLEDGSAARLNGWC